MENWSIHKLRKQSLEKHDPETAKSLVKYAKILHNKKLPVVFTLKHLANITHTDYRFLHDTVDRYRESANYKMFRIRKRSGGFRYIHSVNGKLLNVHKFINTEILQQIRQHPSSYAFHKEGGIYRCANQHCEAKWLFQFDLKDFFYNINESTIYKIFKELGYRDLLSFEFARLCTTTRLPREYKKKWLYPSKKFFPFAKKLSYRQSLLGVLPQGAPTSPMLANLAAYSLDIDLDKYAQKYGFVYTRYADDITISGIEFPENLSIGKLKRDVIHLIRKNHFKENEKKFRVAGPGSRKRVLGLLVNGPVPRLSRETYKRIDRLLHAIEKYGFKSVAEHEKFDSAYGLHNHLSGLIAFTKDVDMERWNNFSERLKKIKTKWGHE